MHSFTTNSPTKIENGMDRKQGNVVLFFINKHMVLLLNSPAKFKIREQKKVVHIFIHTLTCKHNAFLHNSPTIFENGLGRDKENAVLNSTHH